MSQFMGHSLGKGRNALETGLGITPIIGLTKDEKAFNAAGFLNVGYRFQPLRDGLLFRLTWTPFLFDGKLYGRSAGASLGYTFK